MHHLISLSTYLQNLESLGLRDNLEINLHSLFHLHLHFACIEKKRGKMYVMSNEANLTLIRMQTPKQKHILTVCCHDCNSGTVRPLNSVLVRNNTANV